MTKAVNYLTFNQIFDIVQIRSDIHLSMLSNTKTKNESEVKLFIQYYGSLVIIPLWFLWDIYNADDSGLDNVCTSYGLRCKIGTDISPVYVWKKRFICTSACSITLSGPIITKIGPFIHVLSWVI